MLRIGSTCVTVIGEILLSYSLSIFVHYFQSHMLGLYEKYVTES